MQSGAAQWKNSLLSTHTSIYGTRSNSGIHGWHRSQKLNKPYLLKHYTDAHGDLDIEAMVFVQCDTHPDDGLKETAWVTSLSMTEPRIRGIVAWAPLERGKLVEPFVEKLAENPLVKGIRRLIQSENVDFCIQPAFVEGVKTLAQHNLSFDICIFHPQTIKCNSTCGTVPERPIHFRPYR